METYSLCIFIKAILFCFVMLKLVSTVFSNNRIVVFSVDLFPTINGFLQLVRTKFRIKLYYTHF